MAQFTKYSKLVWEEMAKSTQASLTTSSPPKTYAPGGVIPVNPTTGPTPWVPTKATWEVRWRMASDEDGCVALRGSYHEATYTYTWTSVS